MKTALVLGGGGFIGGHLAKRLKNEGFWVELLTLKKNMNSGPMMKYVMNMYVPT